MPHHITQRGNRRQPTFFCEEDYAAHLELMGQWCKERGVAVWAYCLMPNHVHLIAVPKSEDALRAGLAVAPGDYRWSSALAHLTGTDDALVQVSPLLEIAGNWRRLLLSTVSAEQLKEFREHERTGRVLGDEDFQKRLEKKLGRVLRRKKPGPKKASKG